MNVDVYYTHSDCKKCCCCILVSNGSDYENHDYMCTQNHIIEGLHDSDSKPCGLPVGKYYVPKVS